MRYFLHFGYKGTNYHGWQRQPNAISVQEVMEESLFRILKKRTTIQGSSRTDTGVHALNQAAHFDTEVPLPSNFVYRMNSSLPQDIVVKNVREVSAEANSRFDAVERTYQYRIHHFKDPFISDVSLYYRKKLNYEAMNVAAQHLIGNQNFQCFSKVKTDVFTYNCNVLEAVWTPVNNEMVFTIKANRFLRGMVRAIVGTLLLVGEMKISIEDFIKILQSKDRTLAGPNVKAKGLTLVEVSYAD